jgi:predicted metal-binding membrane protein
VDRHLTRPAAQRLVLSLCAAVATLAAWRWLAGASLVALHHGSGAAYGFLYAVVMWQVMVVAMMTPTALPWITAFARLSTPGPLTARSGWASGPTIAFTAGYFLIWLGYSIAAALLQLLVQEAGWMIADRPTTLFAAMVLIGSGVSQFLPLKQACLSHCRNPLTYFLANWRNGPIGGLRMGVVHGAYCLGCCWLVMLSGFALGVMNLAWMAVLTVVLCVEQLAPGGARLGRAFGAGLALWGLWLLM